ncbi:cysteine-rich receptor-like protein kinase [Tanacetum coccineum]
MADFPFISQRRETLLKEHTMEMMVGRRYGKVDDVFIARKRNVEGKRFGFARFNGVVNPTAFEKELNTICIGTQLVRCNIAKYQRKAINNFHNKPLPPSHNNRASYNRKVFGSSYANILTGTKNRVKSTTNKQLPTNFNLTIPKSSKQQYNTSIIGELKSFLGAKNTHNIILDEGFTDFSMKYLGGGLTLLILPWLIKLSSTPRSNLTSTPSNLRTMNHFNRTSGKVCILTRHLNLIHETICVPIDKELVPVIVYEIEGEADSLFNGCILDSSSDEDDPTYTWNGADDLTKNNDYDDDDDDIEEEEEEWCHNGGLGENSSDLEAVQVNSKSFQTLPNLVKTSGYRSSGKHTANSTEEGSTSCTGYKVKDKTKDIPRSASHAILVFDKCTSDNNEAMSTTSPVQNQNPPLNESTTGKSTDYPINYSSKSGTVSDSNEVDNVIQAGNEIGFKMNRKECDVARILDDGDHNIKLQRLKKMIKLWRFDIQCRESKTTTELRCKIDQLDSLVELGPLSAAHIAARTDAVRDLTSFEYIKLNDLKQKLSLGLWRRKASGPDGFTFKFIKKNWHLLENDIISYVKHFESSCHTPRGFNSSFITLVPKLDDPIVLGDYRPLSLIGCQYKIIAKVLANHLKHVLPSVVGEVQMAYIKGRQIIDGPLFVDEIISWAKTHKKKLMLFKVDFEKAFDSLSWNFLLSILEQMGFSAKWRNWICSCLDSAFASVLMNGSPTNEFKLESGLRQGDPLSLFLPILAVEALNIALIEAITTTFFMVLKWVKIRFTSPTFNLPMMPLV